MTENQHAKYILEILEEEIREKSVRIPTSTDPTRVEHINRYYKSELAVVDRLKASLEWFKGIMTYSVDPLCTGSFLLARLSVPGTWKLDKSKKRVTASHLMIDATATLSRLRRRFTFDKITTLSLSKDELQTLNGFLFAELRDGRLS